MEQRAEKRSPFCLRRKQTNSICAYFARHWSDKERKSAITVCWWCASQQTFYLIKIPHLTAPECLILRLWLSDLVSKSTSGCLRASVLQVQRFKGRDKDRAIVLRITGEIRAIETAFDYHCCIAQVLPRLKIWKRKRITRGTKSLRKHTGAFIFIQRKIGRSTVPRRGCKVI